MKRTIFGAAAFAVFALIVVAVAAAAPNNPPSGVTSNNFETNTAGWFTDFGGTIDRQPNSYDNPGDYADNVAPSIAGSSFHARLGRTTCVDDPNGGGSTVKCSGPVTDWGGYGSTWNGTYTTQVDIYLDAAYAQANADSTTGNLNLITDPTNPAQKGTRFDFTSAINNANGTFMRDFGFNVATGPDPHQVLPACSGFYATAGTNVNRSGADAYNTAFNPQCIPNSGWYTFKHTFYADGNNLKVLMQIIPISAPNTPAASWIVTSGDLIVGADASHSVGCNRYGWFSNQEIYGLPIDNSKIEGGCVAPVITGGQILPTGTTCQAYHAGATSLGKVEYTLTKGGKINSVSPGVFFYYGTISGTAGQTFTITQSNNAGAPVIPIQHGQVILYETNCNVVKFTHSDANGVATGTLPSTGTFIVSVKYSPADLKGVSDPGTVTYTIDGTTVVLQKK
jgi:hypothetical protein